MSTSEIADNKWEVQASRPPIFTAAGFAQLSLFASFVAVFGYIVVMSFVGMVSSKGESSLGEMYKNIKTDDAAPAPAPAK